MPTPSEPRIAARCSAQLKRRIERAEKRTGQKESELVRVACEMFFDAHRTPAAVMAAVIQSRASRC